MDHYQGVLSLQPGQFASWVIENYLQYLFKYSGDDPVTKLLWAKR